MKKKRIEPRRARRARRFILFFFVIFVVNFFLCLFVANHYGSLVKVPVLLADPDGVTTVIGPVVAPSGTVATICLCTLKVTVALVPLKFTEVASARFEPLMVTIVPAVPNFGEKSVICGGAGVMLKVALVAEVSPPDVATNV
jgi:hypothetical protein